MKRVGFLYTIVSVIMVACSSAPRTVYKLTDEELSHLMFDIHLADVMLPQLQTTQQDSLRAIYWKRLSEVYQMSAEEIKEEIETLQSDPEKLKIIIDNVKRMADSIQ